MITHGFLSRYVETQKMNHGACCLLGGGTFLINGRWEAFWRGATGASRISTIMFLVFVGCFGPSALDYIFSFSYFWCEHNRAFCHQNFFSGEKTCGTSQQWLKRFFGVLKEQRRLCRARAAVKRKWMGKGELHSSQRRSAFSAHSPIHQYLSFFFHSKRKFKWNNTWQPWPTGHYNCSCEWRTSDLINYLPIDQSSVKTLGIIAFASRARTDRLGTSWSISISVLYSRAWWQGGWSG